MNQISQQRKIIDRLAVAEQLDAVLGEEAYESIRRPELVAVLKTALQDGKDEVQRRFETGGLSTTLRPLGPTVSPIGRPPSN